MADKQTIVNDLRKNYGNMLNLAQLAEVFSCHRKTVPRHVEGLSYFYSGKEKKYLAIDVGNRIYSRMINDA